MTDAATITQRRRNRFLDVLVGLLRGLFPPTCRHEFLLADLSLTGIPELAKPANNDYHDWCRYYQERDSHPGVTRRVKWPCARCGEVFYANNGLEILSLTRGTVRQAAARS